MNVRPDSYLHRIITDPAVVIIFADKITIITQEGETIDRALEVITRD